MRLAIDTHVHVYPDYDQTELLVSAWRNLGGETDPERIGVLFLTERTDCRFFRKFSEEAALPAGFSVAGRGLHTIRIAGPGGLNLVFVAGRQIVAQERLEVLALGRDLEFADGRPIAEVISAVRAAGAAAVLPWSPGKWFFNRGRIIEDLICRHRPEEIAFGDTALRPLGWGEPRLLALARAKGFTVLPGSDPLPLAGEERRVGSYYFLVESRDHQGQPAEFLETRLDQLLRGGTPGAEGSRLGPLSLLHKQIALKKVS